MAKLTPSNKVRIFKQLNERQLPWKNSRFLIREDEYDWLGNGSFSEVYVMEDVVNPSKQYAVKVIGFSEHRRIHKSDIESYKKEPIIQFGLANKCNSIVKIIDTEVVSIQLDESGNVTDARIDDFGVEKTGWLVLVMIKMEKLESIIEQNFTGDYSFKIPALRDANNKEILTLALDVAEALDTSHKLQIMHRDVKLENIFYDSTTKTYKLGDFGIARITNKGSASTKGAGTLGYEAPEVEGGNDSKYSYQADIYSFGITIYLLMNNLCFPGSSAYHVNRSVQYNPTSEISLPMNGDSELKEYICSLIKFKPSDRPESMSIVLKSLEDIYQKHYDDRKMHIVVEKQISKPEVTEEIADISREPEKISAPMNNESTLQLSEVVQKKAETITSKNVIGDVVAEIKKDNLDKKAVSEQQKDDSSLKDDEQIRREPLGKGIIGSTFLVVGLLYFVLLKFDKGILKGNTMVLISLSVNMLASFVSIGLKAKKKSRLPYLLYFVLFCFSIFVMIKSGISWLYVVVSLSLLIGGVTEVFAVSIVSCIALVLKSMMLTVNSGWINEKYVWIFLALALIGLFLSQQYDKQTDLFAVLTSDMMSPVLGGFLLIVVGGIIWILNKIPAINISSLLMNMHLIYVGLILWVSCFICWWFDSKRSN